MGNISSLSTFLANKRTSFLVFALLAIIFVIIEFKGLSHIDPGDEHVYFYMGKLIANGYIPYKDFFLAHPPLLVLFPAILYKIIGFKLIIFKSIELIATILSALFIYLIAKHKFNIIIVLTSVFLFFSSKLILFESTYYLGMGLTTLSFLIGIYYALNKGSYFTAGSFMALSALTRLNSLILILVFAILLFMQNKRNSYRFSLGFLSLFITANLLLVIIAGYSFIQSVYLFHLLKPGIESFNISIFINFVRDNFFLATVFLLFLFAKKKEISLFLVLIASYLVFLLLSSRIFNFYLVLIIPFIAIVAAYSIHDVLERYGKDTLIRHSVLAVLLLLFIANTYISLNRLYNFDFIDFSSFNEIKDYISENSNEQDLLFGDATSTPLLALAAERDIAFNMPDTNIQIFQSGITDINELINKLKDSNAKFILTRPLSGVGGLDEFQAYLEKDCKLAKWFKDPLQGDFLLYEC